MSRSAEVSAVPAAQPATLAIENLSVHFGSGSARIAAVREVSLVVGPGECVGVVGESGSGKTQLCLAVMGLLAGGRATGSVKFEGREILALAPRALNGVRGAKLTMVFQDPMTCLTPHLTVGTQLAEVLVTHARLSWREAGRAAHEMLERVRITEPERRLRQYPHELSGGMRQRVMIGMSLLCGPSLVIADEPTTALDVTVQAQILALLHSLRAQARMAILLVTHDFGVVAGLADRIIVMYAGRVVESAAAPLLLRAARHPYTAELLRCVPDLSGPRLARMHSLAGSAPSASEVGPGCAFAPRCPRVQARCRVERPLLGADAPGHAFACHHPLPA